MPNICYKGLNHEVLDFHMVSYHTGPIDFFFNLLSQVNIFYLPFYKLFNIAIMNNFLAFVLHCDTRTFFSNTELNLDHHIILWQSKFGLVELPGVRLLLPQY